MPQTDLYHSSNDDTWRLCRNESGHLFFVHDPNPASGGKSSSVDVGVLLTNGKGPEQHRSASCTSQHFDFARVICFNLAAWQGHSKTLLSSEAGREGLSSQGS